MGARLGKLAVGGMIGGTLESVFVQEAKIHVKTPNDQV